MKFYKCSKCLSVAMEIIPGEHAAEKTFEELQANTVDASGEKHVPVIVQNGDNVQVKVGEIEHPMLEEHYIMWIYLETKQGGYLRMLMPEDKPEAEFRLCSGDQVVAAYAYCNLHGLWKSE